MPIALYNKQMAIVEAEVELADEYMPIEGQWIFHDLFKGLMPVGLVIYDSKRSAIVLTTKATTYDFTTTLEEWLMAHPEWSAVSEKAFIANRDIADDEDPDEDEEEYDNS